MPGFADSFWTPDYASGLGILYSKLQQGIAENRQILTVASLRADAEEVYSSRLEDITPAVDRITTGFSKDEGASVRKVYQRDRFGERLLDSEKLMPVLFIIGIRWNPRRNDRGIQKPPKDFIQHSRTRGQPFWSMVRSTCGSSPEFAR